MTTNEDLIYQNENLARESEERMREIRRLRRVIRGEEDCTAAMCAYETMSFIYWLANFDYGWLEKCFDGNQHLQDKFNAIVAKDQNNEGIIYPGTLIKFYFELDYSNQAKLIEYVRQTYTGMESHKPKQ